LPGLLVQPSGTPAPPTKILTRGGANFHDKGQSMTLDLQLPASLENLPRWMEAVSIEAERVGIPQRRIREIELALEEALVNIVNYAYDDPGGTIRIRSCLDEARSMWLIQIMDQGKPFDVAQASDPDIHAPLSEREIGGLGIYLIRKLMDEVSYERSGNRNVLTLCVKLPDLTAQNASGIPEPNP
jgi:anti-sigma regulatory factor (Ser/Thr protein kinase)